jgi:predicted GNAT family N-acyltransferase
MASELVEVHVWTSEDGSVTAVGRLLSADRRAEPIATGRQSVTKAMARSDLLDSGVILTLNRETGELEAAE